MNNYNIQIDLTRDSLFDEYGLQRLKDGYMLASEESPQERFAYVANQFSSNEEHAQRMYDYMRKHWWSNSTPILSFGRTKHGLPISCFLPFIPDTAVGLVSASSESRWLSMFGGGIGLGIGIRSSDNKSTGVIPHLKTYDADTLAYRQGDTRRGSIAAYLDISHPDILEFIKMRKTTSGDPDRKCPNLNHGVNISDAFMEIIEKSMYEKEVDDSWPLIDPNTKEVKSTISAKELWEELLELRLHTGEPYLHFIDTSNKQLPKEQKNLDLSIKQSNLCTEIILPTDSQRTAVCCLGSINLEYYDDWKDHSEQFLRDSVEFLDNVLDYFIENAPDEIIRAVYSAYRERSIGIGALGWHALLQKKNIPFESSIAVSLNKKIFKDLKEQGEKATTILGELRGNAPDFDDGNGVGYRRNMHLFAIAPNASSSIIMGNTSPSVEPFRANAFKQSSQTGINIHKNKYLKQVLQSEEKDTDEIWSSILKNQGSVQHLDFLSDWDKDVFKTFEEIDQKWIIQHAGDRQEYIDQAQSINLAFAPDTDWKSLHEPHFLAWKQGLKTLYYCRSRNIIKADNVGDKTTRKEIEVPVVQNEDKYILSECIACE